VTAGPERDDRTVPLPGQKHEQTDFEELLRPLDGLAACSSGELERNRRAIMVTVKTSDVPQTVAADTNGAAEPAATEVVKLDISDPTFMGTAYETYDALREKGRVTRVKFGSDEAAKESQSPRDRFFNRESFFVTHYDDVVATLLDDRFSVDPRSLMTAEQRENDETPEEFRPFARSIISIDPPDHTRIRKLVQPSFTGRGMEAMRPSIQKTVDDLLDTAERAAEARGETPGNRRMELVSQFAYPFPVTVISDLLGIPREDREQIRGWTENLLRVDRGRDEALNEQVRHGLRDFTAYLGELFARKRREPTEDMISRMVLMEDDGDTLTEEETLATVFLMYLAGHVTTVNLVGNGVVALLTHPEQLAKLKAVPGLAKNLVEETLRYWGPVDFIGRRTAKEDLVIANTPIAKGEQVTVSLASANRDPERFADPNTFDIGREDANRHVAFGKGIHVCLGAPLARVEGQVAFATLIRRYPELRLAVPEDEVVWSGNFLRGFRQVPLLF
jgi:cytochrome P450 family 107 subfamily K polypeptide 1